MTKMCWKIGLTVWLLIFSGVGTSQGAEPDDALIQAAISPTPASYEEVQELYYLLKILAVKHCKDDACSYGVQARTSVTPHGESSREIPATLITMLNEKLDRPKESYLGMILKFRDEVKNTAIRITIMDKGMDGSVDLMLKEYVVQLDESADEQFEEKACYSTKVPNQCKTLLREGDSGIDENMYNEAVSSMTQLLKNELASKGGKKV